MLYSVIIGGLAAIFWVLLMAVYVIQSILVFSAISDYLVAVPLAILIICMMVALIALSIVYPNAALTTDGSIAVPERIEQRGEAMVSVLGIKEDA